MKSIKIYYIKRRKTFPKYEIVHKFRNEWSFDGFAVTKIGAKYYAKKIFLEQFIKDNDE